MGANIKERSEKFNMKKVFIRIAQDRVILLIALMILLIGFMAITKFSAFIQWNNISAVLLDTAQSAILTVGMMCLLISGMFDISIGATLAFSGVIAGILLKSYGMLPIFAIIIATICGIGIGFINGLIVTKIRVNAMITTLATQYIVRGFTQIIAPSGVSNLPDGFEPLGQTMLIGLQSPFWIMLIIVLVLWFLMSKTRPFRQLYFIGANTKAAKLSGIKTDRMILFNFSLMGMLAGFSGVLLASRLDTAVVLAGTGVEMRAIAAAILGGASLYGGIGRIPGAFLGALFLSFFQNALIIWHVGTFWQNIALGVILILALSLDQLSRGSAKK